MTIDTTNMCSHLQKKLFEEDGIYHPLWIAMQDDPGLTAVVRSRQLHIYRNGKKVLVLAGKATPKVIRVTMFATGKVTNERWTCAEEGFVLVTTTNLSATLREPSLSSER